MLATLLKEFNISDEKITLLNRLRELCLEYNKHTNLTSITNEEEFNLKHIYDSLLISKTTNLSNKRILDVGSGGGFPGLVLAIVFDESDIVMIDSNNKKTKYIDYIINELDLKNASTINSRIEEAKLNESFDLVTSRAVASLNVLLEITAAAVKVDGEAIYYKGSNIQDELTSDWLLIENELGLKFIDNAMHELDSETNRYFVKFLKMKNTKPKYPRHYSKIKKTPLY